MSIRAAFLLLPLVAAAALAACGGTAPANGGPGAGELERPLDEGPWFALVSGLRLEPDAGKVAISGRVGDGELLLTIAVPQDAPSELAFADGLYGAQAFAYRDGSWERVDTADLRTMIAPLLRPGESAEVRLPVEESRSYRVLVPVEGFAAWADIP